MNEVNNQQPRRNRLPAQQHGRQLARYELKRVITERKGGHTPVWPSWQGAALLAKLVATLLASECGLPARRAGSLGLG